MYRSNTTTTEIIQPTIIWWIGVRDSSMTKPCKIDKIAITIAHWTLFVFKATINWFILYPFTSKFTILFKMCSPTLFNIRGYTNIPLTKHISMLWQSHPIDATVGFWQFKKLWRHNTPLVVVRSCKVPSLPADCVIPVTPELTPLSAVIRLLLILDSYLSLKLPMKCGVLA